ncbi:MAG: heme exporter protein CcmB [Bacteroidales bacterium]|nr:heme exporter protein CcmB [Bacteroidales bacterium]
MQHAVRALIQKDIQLELKQKYALNGILLYIFSTIFVSYLAFSGLIEPKTWNALFWIIILFASVNAISKSFVQEDTERQLYYYTLTGPNAIIMAKITYNSFLIIILSLISLLIYSLFMGFYIQSPAIFIVALILGSMGFSSILTMVAAIAAQTNNNFTLMAILSFPLVLPLLITLMKVSKNTLFETTWAENSQLLLVLLLINVIVIVLAYLLFPYLWKD